MKLAEEFYFLCFLCGLQHFMFQKPQNQKKLTTTSNRRILTRITAFDAEKKTESKYAIKKISSMCRLQRLCFPPSITSFPLIHCYNKCSDQAREKSHSIEGFIFD